ncbi:SET domain protein [Ostertagia ostertagi]
MAAAPIDVPRIEIAEGPSLGPDTIISSTTDFRTIVSSAASLSLTNRRQAARLLLKVRPPSPESDSSQSPVSRRRSVGSDNSDDSDGSDAAQKRSGSSSEVSSDEAEPCRSKSSQSVSSLQKRASPSCSTAVSTASSIASSSESSPPSEDEEQDVSTATEEPYVVAAPSPIKEVEKVEEEVPLWQKILSDESTEWSEFLPRPLYHTHLTEHCYFKLPGDEKKAEKEASQEQKKRPAVVKKGRLNKHDRELLGLFSTAEVLPKPKPQISYPPWSLEDKLKHIHQWDCCFDPEDQEYLKEAFSILQPSTENGAPTPWAKPVRFSFTSWSDKPRLLDKPVKKGRLDQYFADTELDGILPIEGGCARTRGYFKMSMKEKRSLIRRPEDEQRDKTLLNDRDEAAVRHNLVLTKESRSMHRRLLTTMGDTNTDFFKVNQLKYRKKMIKFARSRIHGWGLYAMEAIAPDDMIVEYVGQKVRNTVADVREKAYERRGIGSSYLFRIDDTTVIDATRMGKLCSFYKSLLSTQLLRKDKQNVYTYWRAALFNRRDCAANATLLSYHIMKAFACVVTVDGDKRIVIYSKTLINKGDEITYDYKFPIEEDKVDCLCGAPNCRGTLN